MAKINDLPLLSNPTEDMYCLVGKEDVQKVPWSAIMGQIGAPYIATTVAGMTDKTRVYVYQGSESGYTSGNWYYWNGSAWTSGGTYNSAAVDTDKTLTQSDKPADSAVVGKEIDSLKEDLGDSLKKTGFTKFFQQVKTSEYNVNIAPGTYVFKTDGIVATTVVLYNTDRYDPKETTNLKIWDASNKYSNEIVIDIEQSYKHLHIWQSATSESFVSIELFGTLPQDAYGKKLYEFKVSSLATSYNNITNLTSGKKLVMVFDGAIDNSSIILDTNEVYDANSANRFTVYKNKNIKEDHHVTPVYKLETNYKSIRVFSNTPSTMSIYEVTDSEYENDDKMVEIFPNWTQNLFYENGENSDVLHTDAISTHKLVGNGMYLITFSNDLIATYNVKQYNDSSQRMNVNSYHPFSVFCDNDEFLRISFKRKDGGELLPDSNVVTGIHIYFLKKAKTEYDIAIAPSDAAESKKRKADIILNGINDTRILCAVFGCYNSITAYLYAGTYNISEMYTYTDTAKISLPFNSYNFDGGGNYRRYVTVIGEHKSSPQDVFGGVNFCVTEGLHNSLEDDGVNYFLIGTPYAVSDEPIQRMATSCNISNINIIGYGYDKPITYVDTTRCLSTMLESVNIRSWAKNIGGYEAFETMPNEECCGIRVGRGSNYGIQNYVKHLNVWYCGKGIACNGEHFIFEDVKVHHDYIGFVFGDRKTIGKQEHTNIMIGCSIEGCYRLMLLTKSGVTAENSDGESLPKSTLIMIGTSTETKWDIPQKEVINNKESQSTLPIKELVKNVWRGRIEIDWTGDLFEPGSGANFAVTKY